jgi:tetratricopeptide (TPR) repeat protein
MRNLKGAKHLLDNSISQGVLIRTISLSAVLMMLAACGSADLQGSQPAENAESVYPSAATNSYARALGYMDAGDDTRAMQELEKLRNAYPEYAGPSINLGIIHGRNGRPDAAEEALQRAVAVCSSCASAYNELGILQRRQGRFAEAEQSYLNAIAADPEFALAYFNLGVLYDLYQGRSELALRYYQDYLQRKPDTDGKDVVNKWIIDLQRRIDQPERAAGVGESS